MSMSLMLVLGTCLYVLILCVFALAIIIKREKEYEDLSRQDIENFILWPCTIIFYFITRIHNFVHPKGEWK